MREESARQGAWARAQGDEQRRHALEFQREARNEMREAVRRGSEAVAQQRDWVRSDVLLLRLALAERALGAPQEKEHVQALKARFDAAALRGDKLHLQEEARFNLRLLGQEERALALAQENWRSQREPRDARILLESALALRDPSAAKEALDWLDRSGHEDPILRRTAQMLRKLGQ